jgi:hypothetical protein
MKIMNDPTPHYFQGPHRGQKRRADSPAEYESGGQSHERFRAQEQSGRKAPRHTRRPSSNQTTDFRTGAGESADLTACAICLSRAPHNIRTCKATKRWDGLPTLYSRNADLRIIDSQGNVICSDWQRPKGCTSTRHRHECSGCGSAAHGSHGCPFAQPRNHDAPAA